MCANSPVFTNFYSVKLSCYWSMNSNSYVWLNHIVLQYQLFPHQCYWLIVFGIDQSTTVQCDFCPFAGKGLVNPSPYEYGSVGKSFSLNLTYLSLSVHTVSLMCQH